MLRQEAANLINGTTSDSSDVASARLELVRTRPESTPLPKPLSSFIGRENELEQILQLIKSGEHRLLTLLGPGGIGKTRLAIAVANQIGTERPSFVHFVGLATIRDAAQVLPTIAQQLGLRESSDPVRVRLSIFFAGRQSLLVLDNLEHLPDAVPDIADLVHSCPTLTILTTSREHLRIRGERIVPVAPLVASATPSADLSASPAVRLFIERARAIRSDFSVSTREIEVIAHICQRLDGLPLAIELAASRVDHLTPAAMLQRLDRLLPMLVGGSRDLPTRHKTMRNAIAWSYDFLSENEQVVFRRVAIFPDGFRLEAAEGLISALERNDPSQESELTLDLLGSLVEKSLIVFDPNAYGGARYHMLETIREFAIEQLQLTNERELTTDAFAGWCLAFAEENEVFYNIPIRQEHLDLLDSEWTNVQAALTWFETMDSAVDALRLATALGLFWYLRGHVQVGLEQLQRVLTQVADPGPQLHLRALTSVALLAVAHGDIDEGARYAESLIELLAEVDQPGTKHAALTIASYVAIQRAEYDRAESLLNDALLLVDRIPNALQRATAEADYLTNHGDLAQAMGEFERALNEQEQALAIYRDVRDTWGMVDTLYHLGSATRDIGDFDRSLIWYAECLSVAWDYGDRRIIGAVLTGMALAASARGQAAIAARLIGAADTVLVSAGMSSLPATDQPGLTRAIHDAEEQLGSEQFLAERQVGRALPLDEIPALVSSLVSSAAELQARGTSSDDVPIITAREREILQLLADGNTDRSIGEQLFISKRTVESHVARIAAKLGVRGRTATVREAHRLKLVEPTVATAENRASTTSDG